MKRFALLCLAAAFLVGCQEKEPTGPLAPDFISLDISDGATGGNADFFFFPPLVEEPSGHPNFDPGAFNEFLEPFVKFCQLDVPTPGDCEVLEVGGQDKFPMELDIANEQYKFNWKTSDFGLIDGQNYRIEVYVGSDELPDNRGRLGFRDVTPLSGPSVASCTTATLFCQFNNGSNIPVKVRIEDFAFCPVTQNCVTKSVNLGGGATNLTFEDNVLDVPQQTTLTENGTVNFRTCDVDVANDPTVEFDLPTFGRCLETDVLTPDFDPTLEVTAIISFCNLTAAELAGLSAAQQGLLKVHHFREDDGVEALREDDNCASLSQGPSNPVLRLASRIGDRMLSWVGVRPLTATTAVTHRDSGGNSLRTLKSRFKLALPAKIDFVNPADAERIAPVSTPLTTQAKVTDLFGNGVAGATVRWNVLAPPTEGATVEGTVSPATFTTGANGIAEATWTLASDLGLNKLTAGGRGIADARAAGCTTADLVTTRNCNGPRGVAYAPQGPFDPFQPIEFDELAGDGIDSPTDEIFEEIAEGTRILYSAIGCGQGFGTPNAIDGTIDPGEWDCASQETFPVNLSGGSTVDATFYFMNDGTDFYLAVVVPGTGRENGLRVEWDSDGSGNAEGRELGDDVWEFDPGSGPADKFVDEKCSGSGQSSCGKDDDAFGGVMDTDAVFNNSGGETVYEMSHPLTTDDECTVGGRKGCGAALGKAIDLNASALDTKGLFLTLRLGRGAQGNTQWPGFLDYLMITIK